MPALDKENNFKPLYKTTTTEDTLYHSLRIAADNDPAHPFAYTRVTGTSTAPSYVTRINFAAVVVEFVKSEQVPKPEASVITTALSGSSWAETRSYTPGNTITDVAPY